MLVSLSKMANGSMRDGLSLLDRLISTGAEPLGVDLLEEFLGCADSEKIYALIGKIGDSDAAGALATVDDLINSGHDEVQIVDSLVDYMRDLMVVKSTGPDSKFVVLTSEQRKRTEELAEKFDIAAMVYNITTLEKIRWLIKNSDMPRALLEASLLRFSLSEHFMNVDELLQQSRSVTVKKKQPPATVTHNGSAANPVSPTPADTRYEISGLTDLRSIKANWQALLNAIGQKLGKGTSSLLTAAEPTQFEDGLLTLTFGASAKTQKKICESNNRLETIESWLSERIGKPIKIRLTVAGNESDKPETVARKRDELINDPAVKNVLLELDATITNIEETQES